MRGMISPDTDEVGSPTRSSDHVAWQEELQYAAG